MRLALSLVLSALLAAACAGPYSAPAEKLVMPKKKKASPKADTGPAVPDTCKADFKMKAEKVRSRDQRRRADGMAQDADNLMAGIESAGKDEKRQMVLNALSKASDALKINPYSPSATFTMATAYAWIGKKKCATIMLERLKDLATIPEEVDDALKYKDKVKTHPSFEAFRKDAEAAAGN